MVQTLTQIAKIAGDYFSRAANYVAGKVNFNPRSGIATAAFLGMLAVPSVGKAASLDLLSIVNSQRCLEATTLTLYVAEGVKECNFEERGYSENVLDGVVTTLQGKGYQVRKGGKIKAAEEPYLGQTLVQSVKPTTPIVVVIPRIEDGKCRYVRVGVENPEGNILVSDKIGIVGLNGQTLPVTYLNTQTYNLFPSSCQRLRKLAEEERKKAGQQQPELRSRCEGENDTPSYTPGPKGAKAGSLEKEVACLLAYQTKVLTSCHGVKLPGDNTIPLGFAEVWDMKVTEVDESILHDKVLALNYCINEAGETLLKCLEQAKK